MQNNQWHQCAKTLAMVCETIEQMGGEINFNIFIDGQTTTYKTGQSSFEMEEVGDHFMFELYQDLQSQDLLAEEMLLQLCYVVEGGKNEKAANLNYKWKQFYGKPTFPKLQTWIGTFDKVTNQRIYQATKHTFGAE